MGLQTARGRLATGTRREAPGDEADQPGIMPDVFDETRPVASAIAVRVAQLGTDLGAGAVGPLKLDRREAPVHARVRGRVGGRVGARG